MSERRFDRVITGGRVLDPETGRDEVVDVGITAGTITRIGSIPDVGGGQEIDAAGLVVCPGFVDIHAHGQSVAADWMQAFDGVTTSLELEVGVLPVDGWYRRQEEQGRVLNYGASASWIFARKQVMAGIAPDPRRHPMEMMGEGADNRGGWSTDIAKPRQLAEIRSIVEGGLREGGIGIGIPHGYAPGAGVKEMTELCGIAARTGSPTFTHIPFMSNTDPQSSEEAYIRLIGYAAATGAHMHVCHLNSTSLHDIERCRALLMNAQARGLPITVEAYPYGTGSTVIAAGFFAAPDFTDRTGSGYDSIELIHNRHHMRNRDELLSVREADPAALVAWHFLDPDRNEGHRDLLDLSVLYPGGVIASDAMPWVEPDGSIHRGEEWPLPERLSSHPRSAATFTKFLGDYHRSFGKIGLMEAVAKGTILPCRVIEACLPRMSRKARLQEGCDADVIVFDPVTVAGRASFSDMTAPAVGMRAVLVGGTPVILDGRLDPDARPGRPLRRGALGDG
ncbi:amidohydrolase family protein [Azospirillum sp. RWY-5-1]|uniref:Amidohydrolase family protein n=1 Tax=Azospirillum oleiclasticum TaxID=2735135 RepID=A0ABX2TJB7_9PROT|nr:amidohydrolase family protein [Azospirillum oleiclasticum]NYZ14580.1 amidohydrolase family protein [Azospirillum oleiclasticum]NYZ24358.1 amidohydrolase family protein [Azospirillum oleiclasticum]